MKAAVLHSYDAPPEYGEYHTPVAQNGEMVIQVAAAAQSQLVKARASGKHYSCDGIFPTIPGIDGIGTLPDGRRVYFAFPRSPFGSMAEVVPIAHDCYVEIPDAVDTLTAAAIANPGMSSWSALRERAMFISGESVLINGATGVSGRLAIQIAKFLGAKTVIATGRNPDVLQSLAELGADHVISLEQAPDTCIAAFEDALQRHRVNVIIDYLWGTSAEQLFTAITQISHKHFPQRIRFVQVGNIAKQTITLGASALRSSPLELLGSGLGSVTNARLVQIIGEVLSAVIPANLSIDAQASPLQNVSKLWNNESSARRVFIP